MRTKTETATKPTAQRWSREVLPDGRRVYVVRHDHVPGGTKALVLPKILTDLAGGTPTKFSYATPSWGYAQFALSVTCKAAGHEAHIFVPARKERSVPTALAADAGAVLHEVRPGYLSVVQKRQAEWLVDNPGAVGLPFGLHMAAMDAGLEDVAHSMTRPPKGRRVWVAAGSGTLWRALVRAWPSCKFGVVQIGKEVDLTELRAGDLSFVAPEKFERPAKQPPPFPSASNYDAKVWQFVIAHALDGDVVWNVAG